jgi:two-component system, NarL family, sensor kinase
MRFCLRARCSIRASALSRRERRSAGDCDAICTTGSARRSQVSLSSSARRATLLRRDADAADALLAELVLETQTAIAEVRRLVYDLRPPALDELGLVGALRQHVNRFPGLDVEVRAPSDLPGLPAAVEVAAFRIASEAVTNAARHADARRCVVELSANGSLELWISDDGRGLPAAFAPGVGLTSMRERAAELGGACAFERAPQGGSVIRARLPLELL